MVGGLHQQWASGTQVLISSPAPNTKNNKVDDSNTYKNHIIPIRTKKIWVHLTRHVSVRDAVDN